MDALSRKAHCLYEISCSGVQTTFDDMIKVAEAQDLKYQQIRQQVQIPNSKVNQQGYTVDVVAC